MKRPLAAVALIYAAGVVTGRYFAAPLAPIFGMALGLGVLAGFSRFRTPFLIGCLLFFAGWTNLLGRFAVLSPFDLRTKPGDQPQLAAMQGELEETPYVRPGPPRKVDRLKSIAIIKVTRIRLADEWQPAFGRVVTTTEGEVPPIFCRTRQVELAGVLRPPPQAVAPGLFDYAEYLRWKRIYHQFEVLGSNDWKLLPPIRPIPVTERFTRWAQATLARGLPEEDLSLRLLWAMALGWKTGLTDEVSEPFMQTGTMHIFAISGLHIALIALILVNLLRVAQVPRGWSGALVIPMIWGYTAATGWQPSAIRSTIMMTVVIAGWTLKRPGDLLNSLAASALIILLWQPEQLFQVSFQLSFFVVLSLALLGPYSKRLVDWILRTDPFLPPDLQPRWRQRLEPSARWVLASLGTSLAAWIGSILLVAYYFHLLTPVSLLANLLIVPLSSFALMSNLGSLLAGDWFPGLTILFNHSAWFAMEAMIRASVWGAHLPAAFFYVRSPTALEFAIYYGLLIVATGRGVLAPALRKFFGAGLVVLAGAWLLGWIRHRHDVQLTFLPARGGDAIFLRDPRGGQGLIDGGNQTWAESVTVPFLHGQGVNRLDWLALTHGDINHVGGYAVLRDAFRPAQVVTSHVRYRSPAYREILADLSAHPQIWRKVSAGDAFGPWKVLYPETNRLAGLADEQALVLQGEWHHCQVLLLSDLGVEGQKKLLAGGADLRADMVETGLPARGEPVVEPLLAAVDPRILIVNSADHPATARAPPRLRSRLLSRNFPVIFSSESGAATVRLAPGKWTVETMKAERYVLERARSDRPRD